jgi:GTP cyclohydrolase II
MWNVRLRNFGMRAPSSSTNDDMRALVLGVEDLDDALCRRIDAVAGGSRASDPHRSAPAPDRVGARGCGARSRCLWWMRSGSPLLARRVEARVDAPVRAATQVDLDALELAALSFVTPAVLVIPLPEGMEHEASILSRDG